MYKIDIDRLTYLRSVIDKSRHDNVKWFTVQPMIVEYNETQLKNLETALYLADQFVVKFIYISRDEIAGCENVHVGNTPAMWEIAGLLGNRSCGNSDQAQVRFTDWINKDFEGVYDVREKRKLSKEEYAKMRFAVVVRRGRM